MRRKFATVSLAGVLAVTGGSAAVMAAGPSGSGEDEGVSAARQQYTSGKGCGAPVAQDKTGAPGNPANDPACPPAATGQVAGVTVSGGTARFRGPSGCLSRTGRVTVTGRQIRSVAFTVDGRNRKTLIKADSKGRFVYSFTTRKYRFGVHAVRARITFAAASATRVRTLRLNVTRCRPRTVAKFTG